MASEKKTRRTLQDLTRHIPDQDERGDVLLSLLGGDEPDYSVVMVAVSLLDHALLESITRFMIPLTAQDHAGLFEDSKNGPLSSFSAKIRLAHALGAYGKQARDDLNTIRRIRNAFAHAKQPVGFDTAEVAEACFSLKLTAHKRSYGNDRHEAKSCFLVATFMTYSGIGHYVPPRHPETITVGIPKDRDTVAVDPCDLRIASARLP